MLHLIFSFVNKCNIMMIQQTIRRNNNDNTTGYPGNKIHSHNITEHRNPAKSFGISIYHICHCTNLFRPGIYASHNQRSLYGYCLGIRNNSGKSGTRHSPLHFCSMVPHKSFCHQPRTLLTRKKGLLQTRISWQAFIITWPFMYKIDKQKGICHRQIPFCFLTM